MIMQASMGGRQAEEGSCELCRLDCTGLCSVASSRNRDRGRGAGGDAGVPQGYLSCHRSV